MKEYVIIEVLSCGDDFNRIIKAASDLEAVDKARKEWQRLTEAEKERRTLFAAGACELDTAGEIDYNTLDILAKFKG